LTFIKNKYYIYIDINISYMADLMGHNDYFNDFKHNGGGEDDFEESLNVEEQDFFAGGAKDKNERSFTVEKASIGSFSGGRFISTSAYNAAKKAATAVFRHIDVESGVAKPRKQAATTKNGKEVVVNRTLAQKYSKKNPVSEVNIVLHRIDRLNAQKYYAYTATRLRAERPIVIPRTANGKTVNVSFNFTISVKPAELSANYAAMNAELAKEFNAAKRAAKRRAANGDKPVKARKPKAEKAPKAPKAAKAPKAKKAAKTPKAKAAKGKKITVEDIIKQLSAPKTKTVKAPKTKAAKAPKTKAAKAPKAKTPKTKTAKKTPKGLFGGGSCSFF
jgi:hypothetical protein